MKKCPKIAFIGAGSTGFMKNIIGDILQRDALSGAEVALMDIDPVRLDESKVVANRMVDKLGVEAKISTHQIQREALEGADFVIVAFQIGGYDPCTIIDFEIPKEFGIRQTIADTLGIGGIMRGLRTVPHLWSVCEDMLEVCPDALMIQYVNPMAINTWAIAKKYPTIKQVGLCHSVQHTAELLAKELDIPANNIRYYCAGINHQAFFLKYEERLEDGSYRDLYPQLHQGYAEGVLPKAISQESERCKNIIRYEMMKRTGYYVTESSEHFAEYTPWFIKQGREDLLEKFAVPLDEYPIRCVEQIVGWNEQSAELQGTADIEITKSDEYASEIINAVWTDEPAVIYGNVVNTGLITSLPDGCAVEVPCLVNRNGIQPTYIGELPPQLAAIMRSSINTQSLTVEALMTENPQHIYHAAMMDPHTGAELDLEQIWALVDQMREAHGEWLPQWAQMQ
ncbi:alpha-glucosidase/alpha-galactosidase [Vibrio sp. SCSIO 43137]|uniref:alpha-glucosidase/alpha-galactosidase n=1 Tax=Vibrio sp. SCSIO 43137 TaxID=3021011 RepID=UPI002306EC28|nr:alpha-glucosidase/alpha-galactosidase [Vibrio sp. SCSIO 43137]WCE28833.1 alpha-glucosidase/alpha-galactosidase [Vibrio sp. SCSIO 43137]